MTGKEQDVTGKRPETIDYYTYESDMARAERHVKRWTVACFILFVVLVVSNIAWVWYENQFQDVVMTENTQDGGGTNIMSGGDLSYGAKE